MMSNDILGHLEPKRTFSPKKYIILYVVPLI